MQRVRTIPQPGSSQRTVRPPYQVRMEPIEGQPYSPWRSFPAYLVPVHIAAREELSSGAKVLFAVLGFKCGHNTETWPRLSELARRTGRSSDQVRRWRRELERAGLVTVRERAGRTTLVTLLYRRPPAIAER